MDISNFAIQSLLQKRLNVDENTYFILFYAGAGG